MIQNLIQFRKINYKIELKLKKQQNWIERSWKFELGTKIETWIQKPIRKMPFHSGRRRSRHSNAPRSQWRQVSTSEEGSDDSDDQPTTSNRSQNRRQTQNQSQSQTQKKKFSDDEMNTAVGAAVAYILRANEGKSHILKQNIQKVALQQTKFYAEVMKEVEKRMAHVNINHFTIFFLFLNLNFFCIFKNEFCKLKICVGFYRFLDTDCTHSRRESTSFQIWFQTPSLTLQSNQRRRRS